MHVHTGRGLDKAVETIRALHLQTIQIFTGNPSAWRSAAVDAQATSLFRDRKSTRLNSSHRL